MLSGQPRGGRLRFYHEKMFLSDSVFFFLQPQFKLVASSVSLKTLSATTFESNNSLEGKTAGREIAVMKQRDSGAGEQTFRTTLQIRQSIVVRQCWSNKGKKYHWRP